MQRCAHCHPSILQRAIPANYTALTLIKRETRDPAAVPRHGLAVRVFGLSVSKSKPCSPHLSAFDQFSGLLRFARIPREHLPKEKHSVCAKCPCTLGPYGAAGQEPRGLSLRRVCQMKCTRARHAGASGENGPGQSCPVDWMLAGQGQEICVRHWTRKCPPPKKTMGIPDRFCSHEPGGGRWSEGGGGGGWGERGGRGDGSRPLTPCGREKVHFRTRDPPNPLSIRNSRRLIIGEASGWEP